MGFNIRMIGDFLNDKVLKPALGRWAGGVAKKLGGGNKNEEKRIEDALKSDESLIEFKKIANEELNSKQDHLYKMEKMIYDDRDSARDLAKKDVYADSWLSKNIRPITLAFVSISYVSLIFMTGFVSTFVIPIEVFNSLTSIVSTVYVFYFGGRSIDKAVKVVSDKFGSNKNNK